MTEQQKKKGPAKICQHTTHEVCIECTLQCPNEYAVSIIALTPCFQLWEPSSLLWVCHTVYSNTKHTEYPVLCSPIFDSGFPGAHLFEVVAGTCSR